jgi:hypothetical protein
VPSPIDQSKKALEYFTFELGRLNGLVDCDEGMQNGLTENVGLCTRHFQDKDQNLLA